MSLLETAHETNAGRRLRTLAEAIADRLPRGAAVLDIGCGDGRLDSLVMELRPDVSITGCDVIVRSDARIKVHQYDGLTLPFGADEFDSATIIDVLHHASDGARLIGEAKRVCRKSIVIKDHLTDGFLAHPTLRFMDWAGNQGHGVALPYNYWPEAQWRREFASRGLAVASWSTELPIYPWWASWAFGRKLHFIAALDVPGEKRA